MVRRDKANYMIQAVAHALDVLEELARQPGEIGVTELSKRLKLHKNNVFRLLATLELRSYAEQNTETENYRLGVKALQLGQSYLAQSKLVSRSLPIIKALNDKINETVSIVVLQNGQLQFPLSLEAKRPVKVAPRVAVSYSAKQVPVGRLLLAQLPDATLAEILSGNTPQDAAIRNQLVELRTSGQILDRAATEAEVVAVARVIRGVNNDVIGALEVLIPQYRAKLENVTPAIEEAANAISTAMGYGTTSKTTLSTSIERSFDGTAQNTSAASTGATPIASLASAQTALRR